MSASGQGEVPLLRGLSGPAIRAYMPASSVTTVAYEVRDPSGEAGVEVWGEGELLMAERGAQFRTTLLAGILVATRQPSARRSAASRWRC